MSKNDQKRPGPFWCFWLKIPMKKELETLTKKMIIDIIYLEKELLKIGEKI